ncbi:MAG TPA: hypothetical protein VLU92_08600 [Candidatus Dormibacteraeota bacterium]|nr:hypothetical protein [Candidatus Dormibacteraeota bacterium]
MSDKELDSSIDAPSVAWAPWLTPRRAVLFLVGWLVLFAAFSVVVSNPFQSEPNAGATPNYAIVMYLHGLLIGMVGLMALLTVQVLRMKSLHVRAWICVGAVAATILAAIGGIFDNKIPGAEVALWTQIFGFFALDEILIVLIYGIYKERARALTTGRLPFIAALAASAAMLGAAVMGHLAGWIMEFGNWPGIIGSYAGAVGFAKVDDFSGALVGSHSHEMAVGGMALAITLLVVQFGYSALKGRARLVARVGMAMVASGTALMALFYIVTGITTWAPPAAIANIGQDPNLIPLDDIVTGVLVMGGGVVAAIAFMPLLMKAPVRLAAAWTYVLATATVAVAGYTIELNTSHFGAGDQTAAGAAGDAIFTWLHQDIGLFLLPTMLVVMLFAERLSAGRRHNNGIGLMTITGTTVLFAGGMFWVFINPALHGPGYYLATAGALVTGVAVLATIWYGGLAAAVRSMRSTRTLSARLSQTRLAR